MLIVGDQMNYAYPDVSADAIFAHWIVYNIPPPAKGFEGMPPDLILPDGSLQGLNDYPPPYAAGYGGPCPGYNKKHLYIFSLYALDTTLDLPAGADLKTVQTTFQGYILAQAELKAYYLVTK